MTLSPSSHLGPYEIIAPLGSGGMGEVYRARDTRLKRDVALKVLRAHLMRDADAEARFARETRAVAALSHQNILAIHDVGTANGIVYAVMELLDGETLRARLRQSPIPWRKAVSIALQVADGLAAAHARSIVHRDLKPENIFLTSSGQVKILDFGLARVTLGIDREGDTTLGGMTEPGTILGTVGYMSPEQIRGDEAAAASDIFSFGCVLYEMLCGHGPFVRPVPADTMAAALRDEPAPLAEHVPGLASPLEAIVFHCLEKRPQERFQSARDMGFALRAVASPSGTDATSSLPSAETAPTRSRRGRWWLAAGLSLGLAAGIGGTWMSLRLAAPAPAPAELTRLSLALPSAGALLPNDNPSAGSSIAISQDGRWVAYVVAQDGKRRIALRGLDRYEEKILPGTDGAMTPIFSPDGRWVAFFTETAVKKVPLTGGTPTIVGSVPPVVRGAVWADDDTIYFSESFSSGLKAVSSGGGEQRAVTAIDLKAGESNHLLPEALPGSGALLFTVWKGGDFSAASIWSVSLRTGERKRLVESASAPRYVPPGFLVFGRNGALFAVRFDPERLTVSGDAVPVVDGVWTDRGTGTAHYAVAGNGTLVYAPGGNTVEQRRLVWVDRRGRVQPLPAEPNVYGGLRLSPDGRRLAVEILNDIWVYDLAAGTLGKVTSRGVNQTPAWVPDGRHVAFSSSAGFADAKLHWTDVETDAQPEPLTREGSVQFPGSWTPDGLTLGYAEILGSPAGTEFGWDIWLLRRGATTTRSPLVRTRANEDQPMFSPDGRTLAYVSDESGQRQVYVRPFPEPGRRTLISTEGGTEPVWSRRGDELFFRNARQYFSVPIVAGDSSRPGRPSLMFAGEFVAQGGIPGAPSYGVAADSQRFIMVQRLADAQRPMRLDVVLSWVRDIEGRVRPAGSR
jgi:serine/threonine-protein kinase